MDEAEQLKNKVEALLFSSGRKLDIEEIAKLCRKDTEVIKKVMGVLKSEYDRKDGPVVLVEEEGWRFIVKEDYMNLVRKIVTQTELTKSVIETLATIAWKAPVLQSQIIKIRTNKAYDHMRDLEKKGYVTRKKHGRTMMISLAQKFYDYFDIPQQALKEQFKKFEDVEKKILEKEEEIEEKKEKMNEMKKKAKENEEKHKKEMEKLGDLDVYDEPEGEEEEAKVEPYEEKVGELEVVDQLPETKKEEKKKEEKKEEEAVEEESSDVDKRIKEIMGEVETEEKPDEEEESSENVEKSENDEKEEVEENSELSGKK